MFAGTSKSNGSPIWRNFVVAEKIWIDFGNLFFLTIKCGLVDALVVLTAEKVHTLISDADYGSFLISGILYFCNSGGYIHFKLPLINVLTI